MEVIEARYSRYKKNNLLIIMGILLVCTLWFAYDGYFSKYEWSWNHDFYKKHVIYNGGVPDGDMKFNMYSPPFFLAAAVVLAIRYYQVKNKKLVADETALHIDSTKILYESIESINKTYFDKKGYFLLTYKDDQQQEKELKLSDRTYDNLGALLDTLISKIS